MEQRIKQDDIICIGKNIRRLRKEKGLEQAQMARLLQLQGIPITRQTLVKIEIGIHHVPASWLEAIRDLLATDYEELLKHTDGEQIQEETEGKDE